MVSLHPDPLLLLHHFLGLYCSGLLEPDNLPITGRAQATKVKDPTLRSNELILPPGD